MNALTRSEAIVSEVTYTHHSNRPARDLFSKTLVHNRHDTWIEEQSL
jgi:hypothetical protein